MRCFLLFFKWYSHTQVGRSQRKGIRSILLSFETTRTQFFYRLFSGCHSSSELSSFNANTGTIHCIAMLQYGRGCCCCFCCSVQEDGEPTTTTTTTVGGADEGDGERRATVSSWTPPLNGSQHHQASSAINDQEQPVAPAGPAVVVVDNGNGSGQLAVDIMSVDPSTPLVPTRGAMSEDPPPIESGSSRRDIQEWEVGYVMV